MSAPCNACVAAIAEAAQGDLVECHAECLQAIAAPVAALAVVREARQTVAHWRDQLGDNPCQCGTCIDAELHDDEGGLFSSCRVWEHETVVDDFTRARLEGEPRFEADRG